MSETGQRGVFEEFVFMAYARASGHALLPKHFISLCARAGYPSAAAVG
jgi:hypothetical protein